MRSLSFYATLLLMLTVGLYTADVRRPALAQNRDDISKALERALPLVQRAAANYPKHRSCFSCHHQTLPMLAMVSARQAGLKIDEDLLKSQAEFTHKSFRERIESLKQGRGIGGQAMTVGYGLSALQLAGWKPDETTDAMVTFLLRTQKEDGRWAPQTSRPPLEDSDVSCTALAVYGMKRYGSKTQQEQIAAAITRATGWLPKAPLQSQEDRVAKLWALRLLDGKEEEIRAAREVVLKSQREDGGWAQLDTMSSDAYATGQTLYVLRASGLPVSHESHQRGVQFLLKTQLPDGSWFVQTRSEPIQIFFDNGDPHGKHQFISTPATCWAVAALARAKQN